MLRWKHFDAQTWPDPTSVGELAATMRQGAPSRTDMALAATVIGAYAALGSRTRRQREEIFRRIADPSTPTTPPRQAVISCDDAWVPRVIHRLHEARTTATPGPACGARTPVVGWRNTSADPSTYPCRRTKCWDGPHALPKRPRQDKESTCKR